MAGVQKGIPRMRWSREEEHIFVKRMVELVRNGSAFSKKDAMKMGECQEGIDPSRRKKQLTYGLQKTLIKQAEAYEKEHPVVTPPQEPSLPETHAAISAAATAAAQAATSAATLEAMNPLNEFLRPLVESFGHALGATLGPIIAQSIKDSMQAASAAKTLSSVAVAATEAVSQRSHLPNKFVRHKIAIIGLNDANKTYASERLKHLDLRFINAGVKGAAVTNVTQSCEVAFAMIKFIPHATFSTDLKCPRVNVNGGLTELVRVVTEKFPPSTSMEA